MYRGFGSVVRENSMIAQSDLFATSLTFQFPRWQLYATSLCVIVRQDCLLTFLTTVSTLCSAVESHPVQSLIIIFELLLLKVM